MLVGYEREFFVFEHGCVAEATVDRRYRDKSSRWKRGYLVEARGCPGSTPAIALSAYEKALYTLKNLVENKRQTLFLAAELPTKRGIIPAGFHVHFGLRAGEDAQAFVRALETHFGGLIARYKRDVEPKFALEKKPWGFEFRRLPATVDPVELTKVLSKIWPN